MHPILFLSRAFIQTFGITQPTPERERRIAWFLAGLVLLVIGLVAGVAVLLHAWFVQH